MLTLTLFRHAKSSWDHPDLSDFDRPLNERGKRDAPAMGRFLMEQKLIPDLIFCSTAKRACDTLALASAEWPVQPKKELSEALYLASEEAMLTMLCSVSGTAAHVMMIGHNPGIHALAVSLTGSGDQDARYALADNYPTAAMTRIVFERSDWQSVKPGDGDLKLFLTPALLNKN